MLLISYFTLETPVLIHIHAHVISWIKYFNSSWLDHSRTTDQSGSQDLGQMLR